MWKSARDEGRRKGEVELVGSSPISFVNTSTKPFERGEMSENIGEMTDDFDEKKRNRSLIFTFLNGGKLVEDSQGCLGFGRIGVEPW